MRARGPVAAVVGVGLALGAVQMYGDLGECGRSITQGGIEGCMPNLGGPSGSAEIGDIEVKSQNLTGIAQIATYGEVTVTLGGEESEFKYDDAWWRTTPFLTDARLFWNRKGKGTYNVIYNPCIKNSNDYTEPISDKMNLNQKIDETPGRAVSYNVVPNAKQGVKEVDIDAGTLDACFLRPGTDPSNDLWSTPNGLIHFNRHQFGSIEEKTARWMISSLTEAITLANACPQKVLNTDAVKDNIKGVVFAAAVKKYPQYKQSLTKLYTESPDKFKVDLDPPSSRQDYYRNKLDGLRGRIASMDKTLPDNKGKRHDMHRPKIGNLSVKNCTAAQAVGAKADQE
jgi:hypothetical protein